MPKTPRKTPASLGYSFPPEWHPHTATWFSWPRPEGISFPDKYHAVPANLAAIIREIVPHEQVHINVPNGNWEHIVRQQLKENGCPTTNVYFHHIKTNESWCRDHGPAFILRKFRGKTEAAIVDWGFNAWGGKYPPCDLDEVVPTRVGEILDVPVFYPRMILEGGSIEVNGAGALLTSESCLLNENRNPNLKRDEIEQRLRDFLGVREVLWLGRGIEGDDTDGHIDDLARFVSERVVVTVVEEKRDSPNYQALQENLARLRAMKIEGAPVKVFELPMPRRIVREDLVLPASYANFYIANNCVLLPTFADPMDEPARETLQRLFPDRKVIGIDCRGLIWGLGTFHCLTQQQPKVL